jgi:hypothetical protein
MRPDRSSDVERICQAALDLAPRTDLLSCVTRAVRTRRCAGT